MSQRAPDKAGAATLRVTRPITVPNRILNRNSWFLFVDDSNDYPPCGAAWVTHRFSRCQPIRGNNHALVYRCAVCVNRHLGHAFRLAGSC